MTTVTDEPTTTDTEAADEQDRPAVPARRKGNQLIAHIEYESGYETTKLFDNFEEAFEKLSKGPMRTQAGGMESVSISVVSAEGGGRA